VRRLEEEAGLRSLLLRTALFVVLSLLFLFLLLDFLFPLLFLALDLLFFLFGLVPDSRMALFGLALVADPRDFVVAGGASVLFGGVVGRTVGCVGREPLARRWARLRVGGTVVANVGVMVSVVAGSLHDVHLDPGPSLIVGLCSPPGVVAVHPIEAVDVVDRGIIIAHDPHVGVDLDERRRLHENDRSLCFRGPCRLGVRHAAESQRSSTEQNDCADNLIASHDVASLSYRTRIAVENPRTN
jgi:hypothetical protein